MDKALKKLNGNYATLGKLSWLWMSSPLHSEWPTHLMSKFLLRAIELEQCMVIERDGLPVAYCSWAWFDAEAEAAYILNPSQMDMKAWNCGDRLWFIDWIAPFGSGDSWELRSRLAQKFSGQVARAIRVKPGSSRGRIMEFKGASLSATAARRQLDQSYRDFLRTAQAMDIVRVPAAEPA